MKQTVITVKTIRLTHFGEPAEDQRILTAPIMHDEPHQQNPIIDEENVWVIDESMFYTPRHQVL
jgi:hypothetical protein